MKTNFFLTTATTIAAYLEQLAALGLNPSKYSVTITDKPVCGNEFEVTVKASANDLRRLRKILSAGDAS